MLLIKSPGSGIVLKDPENNLVILFLFHFLHHLKEHLRAMSPASPVLQAMYAQLKVSFISFRLLTLPFWEYAPALRLV